MQSMGISSWILWILIQKRSEFEMSIIGSVQMQKGEDTKQCVSSYKQKNEDIQQLMTDRQSKDKMIMLLVTSLNDIMDDFGWNSSNYSVTMVDVVW